MKEEKDDDEVVVEEVVKNLMEYNLYMKPKKCKWKVREIDFLRVVIEPEGIEMKEDKIKGVSDQPTPKRVKDM